MLCRIWLFIWTILFLQPIQIIQIILISTPLIIDCMNEPLNCRQAFLFEKIAILLFHKRLKKVISFSQIPGLEQLQLLRLMALFGKNCYLF